MATPRVLNLRIMFSLSVDLVPDNGNTNRAIPPREIRSSFYDCFFSRLPVRLTCSANVLQCATGNLPRVQDDASALLLFQALITEERRDSRPYPLRRSPRPWLRRGSGDWRSPPHPLPERCEPCQSREVGWKRSSAAAEFEAEVLTERFSFCKWIGFCR